MIPHTIHSLCISSEDNGEFQKYPPVEPSPFLVLYLSLNNNKSLFHTLSQTPFLIHLNILSHPISPSNIWTPVTWWCFSWP